MGETHWDAVVIGAGPAGSRAAELLAGEARRVLVIERRSEQARPKLCGGLLNRRSQELLAKLGELPPAVRCYSYTPGLDFPELEYHDIDNRIRARYDPGYRNISRPALDAWLASRAAQAGAQFRRGQRVGELVQSPQGVTVRVGDDLLQADWVIDASGAASFSRRPLGGPPVTKFHALQGEGLLDPPPPALWAVFHTDYTPFYSWLIPKGDGRCLLGTALSPAGLKWRREAAGEGGWGLLAPVLEHVESRGYRVVERQARPRGAVLTRPTGSAQLWWGRGRVIAAGEAAGLVSPFSGEGVSYALSSAEAAAFAVLSGGGAELMPKLTARLAGALRLALIKAWAGERPAVRPWALWLLPLATHRPLRYRRWSESGGDM